MHSRHLFSSALLISLLSGCETFDKKTDQSLPKQSDRSNISQIAKSDFDRLADMEMRENTQSLRALMIKLYKRNPQSLKKSTSGSLEDMVQWVFEGKHQWQFKEIKGLKEKEAISLALDPDYQGDRVLPFIVGLQTMLIKAHGDKQQFYITDNVDPQKIYNLARNFEIAAWKLANARNAQGQLLLVSNEINEVERNLSFEREFGKMIGRTDMYALLLAEKSQRLISRIMQNLATAVFLPL
jgi:hypothetical protein